MDIEKFLQTFFNSIKCKKQGDGYILSLPILYDFADEISSFYLSELEGDIVISDMGKTFEYLNSININQNKYAYTINKLCNTYGIKIENNCLVKKLPSYESKQTMRALYSYLGVLNFIANLNVFED